MRLIERFNITAIALHRLNGGSLRAFRESQTERARAFGRDIEAAQARYAQSAGGNASWTNGGKEAFDCYMQERSTINAAFKRDLARALLQVMGRA